MEDMGDDGRQADFLLPEWGEGNEVGERDEAAWIAAIEASRRRQFAELSELQ